MPPSRVLDLDSLMSLPKIAVAAVSPDKEHLSLTISRIQENYDVFLKSVDGTGELIPLTKS